MEGTISEPNWNFSYGWLYTTFKPLMLYTFLFSRYILWSPRTVLHCVFDRRDKDTRWVYQRNCLHDVEFKSNCFCGKWIWLYHNKICRGVSNATSTRPCVLLYHSLDTLRPYVCQQPSFVANCILLFNISVADWLLQSTCEEHGCVADNAYVVKTRCHLVYLLLT